MELISSVTVGAGGATSMEFTSIPQTYTDLTIVASTRAAGNFDFSQIRINGSSSAIYSYRYIRGTGSAAVSSSASAQTEFAYFDQVPSGSTANTFSNNIFFIPNYTSSVNKSVSWESMNENNATAAESKIAAGLFASTSPVTSISIGPFNGNTTYVQHTTAYLYGTLKGSGGATATSA
jgi:hypothetical protein